jgi:hypothetical protein
MERSQTVGASAFLRLKRALGFASGKNANLVAANAEIVTRSAPTRIACYDLSASELVEEIEVEQQAMNTIFSIHVAVILSPGTEANNRSVAEINAG